jgi:hypothetical protein
VSHVSRATRSSGHAPFWCVDGRRALLAQERIRDVAGDAQLHFRQPRIDRGQVHDREVRDRAGQPAAGAGPIPDAECVEQTGAAVGGGAAADAHQDVANARIEDGPHDLAGAHGRCRERAARFAVRQPR